jgi:hypothetical protein
LEIAEISKKQGRKKILQRRLVSAPPESPRSPPRVTTLNETLVLVDHVFFKWGLCFEVLSDQGEEFEADLLAELLKILGELKLRSSGYRPQTNGACEAWHKVFNSLLAKVISDSQRDWVSFVGYLTFCYNATPHSSTGFAPHFIMTGQQPPWNVDFLLDNSDVNEQSVPEYTASVLHKLGRAFELTREHLQRTALSMSTWYNRKIRPKSFIPVDVVHCCVAQTDESDTGSRFQRFY